MSWGLPNDGNKGNDNLSGQYVVFARYKDKWTVSILTCWVGHHIPLSLQANSYTKICLFVLNEALWGYNKKIVSSFLKCPDVTVACCSSAAL